MSRVAAVVLAAGGSHRMGSPKQLLQLDGESLVRRAVRTALASRCDRVYVVVGAHASAVTRELRDLPSEVIENPGWEEGLASSIRCGVTALEAAQPLADAALLTLADQPRVTPVVLDRLIDLFEREREREPESRDLVACEYADTIGVPALFGRRYFDALRSLTGDRGARAVLSAEREHVARVAFAPAAIDVDTPADHAALVRPRVPKD
jgi:molybdenum cofactor cytidylyltransferase